jgi:hypothetical protein
MGIGDPARRVAAHLHRAVEADRDRTSLLDSIARGDTRLTPDDREELTAAEKQVRALLNRLAGDQSEIRRRTRVVELDSELSAKEAVPKALTEAYSLLSHAAYGSDPSVSIGDSAVIRGIGKVRARTSTSSAEGVGGSAKNGKRPGLNTRSVIRDRRAYELKIRTDRKLRRVAKELQDHLAGGQESHAVINSCSRCGRIGDESWAFCPACGHSMTTEEA